MSAILNPTACDCGACCVSCGHEQGCSVFEPPPAPVPYFEVPPDSFLASLRQPVRRAS